MTPFFSVIVPVYDRAHLLARTLKSVLAQTFADFEIVVIDDGSHDDPEAVVRTIADPRIRLFRQENKGGGAARNAGIDRAKAKFVAFLDSDDEFLPHHLETMHRLLAGSDNTAAYARIVVDRGGGRTMLKPPRAIAPDEDMATYLTCTRGFVPTITLCLPTAIARRVRYHEALRKAEDTDFAIRLALARTRFVMANQPAAIWHDLYDPNRSSAGRSDTQLIPWLDSIRAQIPARAYHGYRGWAIAKVVAGTSPRRALGLYLTALTHGCYRPRLAAIVFLQIFLPDRLYRRIADRAIAAMGAFTKRKPSEPSVATP